MSYKSILVHVDDTSRSAVRVQIAAQLAKSFDAHLTGVAVTGISRFIYQDGGMGITDPGISTHIHFLQERAEKAALEFDRLCNSYGVSNFERAVTSDEAGNGVGLKARYSDLVVIGQNDPEEPSPSVSPDFPEFVVLNAGRPILIVPYVGEFKTIGKRPLLAWDASRAATRALTDALPLLKQADLVHVAVFNARKGDPDAHGDIPGADIALYLARHGVKVEVTAHQTETDVGNALLSLTHDLNNDLLVMGGYGHSRFREMLMGGVTRTILESMTVPVLMSH